MFETTVIDDLVSIDIQRYLHDTIMKQADWKFLNDVSGADQQTYPSHGFVHLMKHPDVQKPSHLYYPVTEKIIPALIANHIKFKTLYHARIFLQLPLAQQYNKEHNGIHVDLPKDLPHIACVYYVNGSDGDTIIYEQTSDSVAGDSTGVQMVEHMRVRPKRGRAVLFDGSRYHCSSQPNINYRCIINFDLLKVNDGIS